MTNQNNSTSSEHPNPGEEMNIREVHQAIVRELPEPSELYKKVPWYLRHFYAILAIWFVVYLAALAGTYDWNVFDTPLEEHQKNPANQP